MTPETTTFAPIAVVAWTPVISAIVAASAVWVTFLMSRRTLWQKANEMEIAQIQSKLDGFYGPFMQMSGANRLLARDLRARQKDGESFLLIEKLFDKAWRDALPKGEAAIIAEIAANAGKLRILIDDRTGMIDEDVLPYLSRVSVHYRMIELAYDGALGDDPSPFVRRYVFPSAIDKVIAREVKRLKDRQNDLRAKPGSRAKPIAPLSIPAEDLLQPWDHPPRKQRPELTQPVL